MQVLPEFNKPILIDSLTAPIVIKYNWMFSGHLLDFLLTPITYLEETSGSAVKVRINNFDFWIPATWFILVVDSDTLQIDTVSITSCASNKHYAYPFSPQEMNLKSLDVRVLDYSDDMSLVHPMISKGQLMVHPVGPVIKPNSDKEIHISVVIGPYDLYKHLNNKVLGDIMF